MSTDSNVDDASVAPDLVDQIPDDKKITRFTADGAYDTNSIYETCAELGAKVVVPPIKTAVASRAKPRGAKARNRTIKRVRKVGRRKWKKETGYHQQGRAENTCHYNFVRRHRELRFGSEFRTPAMQAGLTTRPLTRREIFLSSSRFLRSSTSAATRPITEFTMLRAAA